MVAEHKLLVICSFFQSDSLVGEAVRVFGEAADLYLVPIEPEVPVPAVARPFLPSRKLGIDERALRPCKKWRTIDVLLERLAIDRYDYCIFPDDDLEYGKDFVPRFLTLLDTHEIALAQPALTPDSYHTYDISVRREDAVLRLTNFVEIMIPCFRRDCLQRLRRTLDAATSPMGYGFDLHWPYACADAGFRMAIVDDTPVAHRFRPTGKHYGGDDLHGQGYAYGRRFPRILPHEIREIEPIPRRR
ncbi:MAG: DUF707 domain-containing protein [Candidatus Binatia bacterium]